MSMFRRHAHQVPGLNTSSLPDLIFTVLFFFMIVTHMRKANVKVKYQEPAGTELTRLTKRSATSYIYVGTAGKGPEGGQTAIQLNDRIVSVSEMKAMLSRENESMDNPDKANMEVSIKADRDTKMGVITDIKQALREAGVLKIHYSATSKNAKNN